MKNYLEITLDSDKRAIAAILVANGYCVCIEVISNGKGRGKKVLAYWKEDKKED
jgi:hypothetical protein